jgi:hypothetical protein
VDKKTKLIMTKDSSAGKSFAERFAKKSNFTSQNIVQKQTQQNPNITAATNKKAADPQKKMQSDLIYLVKGIDAGRNAWYYVLVERLKLQLFLKALNDDIIHLENYGKILYSAYGDEPPEHITKTLKDEYGID